ncbi:hypothetical protein H6G27_32330 [Nostoc linckia FACHB-104]|nr:hypothetical protein [Nostoc linckia FACHB-104]
MTDPSLGRNKKKITITASQKGVDLAENALIRLGFNSKSNFAQSQLLARNTVTNFFQRKPIQLDSFKRICPGFLTKIERRGVKNCQNVCCKRIPAA